MTQRGPSLRILVVDDDPVLIDLIPSLLSGLGHSVDTANTGELALQRLAAPPPLDAALIDLRMPGMDGPSLAGHISALPNPPRLIGMSGSEIKPSQSIHFDAFLEKPFGIDGLIRVLSDAAPGPGNPSPIRPTLPRVDPTILDTAIYNRLLSSMTSDQLQQLYQRTLDYIRHTAPAFDTATTPERLELAHTLHGSCAMVGAVELVTVAADIQTVSPDVQNCSPGSPLNSSFSYKILRASDRLERILKLL
jgi:CheY-like chemotaxis protein